MVVSEDLPAAKVMLDTLVKNESPIFLPWCKANLFMGDGFESDLARLNQFPWKGKTPFKDVKFTTLESDLSPAAASFRESTSDNSKADSSHLSASFGVTVGCDYLNANVTGSYDQAILNSSQGSRTSRNMSYTAGRVYFADTPSLDVEALELAASNPKAFRKSFGDYFVAGFQLGANAGMSLISQETSHDQKEMRKVSLTAHFLLWDKTTESVDHNDEATYGFDISFCGYNSTIDDFTQEHCAAGGSAGSVLRLARSYGVQIAELQATVDKKLSQVKLDQSSNLPWHRMNDITTSGLVSHVILCPFSQLPEVASITRQSV